MKVTTHIGTAEPQAFTHELVTWEKKKEERDQRRRKAQLAMNLHASRYYSDWSARFQSAMKIVRGY